MLLRRLYRKSRLLFSLKRALRNEKQPLCQNLTLESRLHRAEALARFPKPEFFHPLLFSGNNAEANRRKQRKQRVFRESMATRAGGPRTLRGVFPDHQNFDLA